jgi:hypothetical protein
VTPDHCGCDAFCWRETFTIQVNILNLQNKVRSASIIGAGVIAERRKALAGQW